MKLTLHLAPVNRLPAGAVELASDRILTNDVVLPGEFNPYHIRLWVVGDEYGALGAVWAKSEEGALDELVNADLVDDEPDNYAWIQVVELDPARDWRLIAAFAEARGAGADNLFDYDSTCGLEAANLSAD